jgi:hypothetical protein
MIPDQGLLNSRLICNLFSITKREKKWQIKKSEENYYKIKRCFDYLDLVCIGFHFLKIVVHVIRLQVVQFLCVIGGQSVCQSQENRPGQESVITGLVSERFSAVFVRGSGRVLDWWHVQWALFGHLPLERQVQRLQDRAFVQLLHVLIVLWSKLKYKGYIFTALLFINLKIEKITFRHSIAMCLVS